MKKKVFVIVLNILLCTVPVIPAKKVIKVTKSGETINLSAPDFILPKLGGTGTFKLSEFKGKVIILDFWATWCGPCRAEIPGFVKLYKKYNTQGLEIIGVNVWEQGSEKNVVEFMKKTGITYPIVIGNDKVIQDYGGIVGIPTTFILDRNLVVKEKFIGYVPEKSFEQKIIPLLKKK